MEDPLEVEDQEEVLQPESILRHEDKVLRHAVHQSESTGYNPTHVAFSYQMDFQSGHFAQPWINSYFGSAEASTSGERETLNDYRNQEKAELVIAESSVGHELVKVSDSKVLRRLAQNREAARKSRLRKKAYVQQLETSRVKLNQLEQELDRLRQTGCHAGVSTRVDQRHPGVAAFDMEYSHWVEKQNQLLCKLRTALMANMADNDLHTIVENGITHYDDLFRLKSNAVKVDVFHIVSGMWKTPAERCFMWMGGFRPSDLLKIVLPQLEPLSEQQTLAICNLQQSSQQAEDALSQGMEALQQNLAEILSTASLVASNVANYMGQMAMAMGKLGTLENFVLQADNLRQQTLHQLNRILTTRQGARGLLAIGDYFSRLRALSSLWVARPRE
ncbi:hypothetical protein L7F22_010776 [Adiantum nelumboides]|nr:hypothetical protein [Adiantum nelumboides]